jgi:hypothetical protein
MICPGNASVERNRLFVVQSENRVFISYLGGTKLITNLTVVFEGTCRGSNRRQYKTL